MAKQSQVPRGTNAGKSVAVRGVASRSTNRARSRRGRSRSSNQVVLWLVIGAVVLIFGAIVLLNWQSLFGGASSTPHVSEGVAWGPANAPVKVVEYSNFGCSHCRDFALGSGKTLRQEYEATGKVRFEFRQFKLADPTTTDAANAALCAADQSRFWDYHDRLFEQQGTSARPFAKANLKQYGSDLGLDSARFGSCVDNDQHMAQVNQESQEGISKGVSGTPTFFVNGKMIEGNVPYAELKAAIDQAAGQAGS